MMIDFVQEIVKKLKHVANHVYVNVIHIKIVYHQNVVAFVMVFAVGAVYDPI
ncbi:hypothetical protein BLA29_009428 [Euroglyphus maynei]|uniref:Uncharacterized protein n=1 Tax=Euroglyphus maynei TaxID=6958 RepID=A0A1Y3BG92_EURMA|nr:hypothetical protein BLA29_009428 [Euroglyphus maynei]